MNDRRLLILDDDLPVAQTIQSIAEDARFETRITTEPDDFLQQADRWAPTHIMLDLVMPEMDGVEVLRELAQRNCQAELIIVSGVGSRVLDAAARSAAKQGLSVAGVLGKPFSAAILRQMLGAASAEPARSPHQIAEPSKNGISPAEIEQALEDNQFEMVYQPVIHCQSSELAGFEALVRLNCPQRGTVWPESFIPLAESTGLIKPLTHHIISESFDWFAELLKHQRTRAGGRSGSDRKADLALVDQLTLSINLSAIALDDVAFVDTTHEKCLARGIDPKQVVFELTETSAMDGRVTPLDLLIRLRMKGFRLSIDDFGTGYSSMLQLVRLPFSEIKVDKSFVTSDTVPEESRAVIRSVVDLGHSMGLVATAEGVEDDAAMAYLREVNCDLAQGYLISPPMCGASALAWTREHQDS
ncbi:MAG: EAL domain-containing protein [Wenzhouxiangella sp.]